MKVGVIGLGRMGAAMASRLIDPGGHDLIVYDQIAARASPLVAAGAQAASDIAGACADREVVITMLSDDRALSGVALSPGGLCRAVPPRSIHLAMGTHGVDAIRALTGAHADAGQTLVAGPVLGRPEAAAAGTLGIIVAGAAEALRSCDPLLRVLGERLFVAGAQPECATIVKLANGLVLSSTLEALGEAFALVRKFDVSAEVIYDVLAEGFMASLATKSYGRLIVDDAYDQPGFTVDLALKDLDLILDAGRTTATPLPSANVVHDHLLSAVARGNGHKDWAIIAQEQARASGLEV